MFRNGLQPWQLLIVAVVITLLPLTKKLPETARRLGRSMRLPKAQATPARVDSSSQPSASPTRSASEETATAYLAAEGKAIR